MLNIRATIALALVALVFGLWAGYEWRHGRDGIAEAAQLKQERAQDRQTIADLKAAGIAIKQNAVDQDAAYRAAEQRLGAIASQLEQDRAQNRTVTAQLGTQLDALLALRADLRSLRLGNDVLQHWNESNAGRPADVRAAPAAAPAAGQPAGAMPRSAPAGGKRPGASAAREPRRGDGDLPRLQGQQQIAAASDGRMARHGNGLVLQGREGRGPVGDRMWVISHIPRLSVGDARVPA